MTLKLLKKLIKANKILKELIINEDFPEYSWVITDFIKENRFFKEIKSDENIKNELEKMNEEEIAEYAFDQIVNNY